MSAATAAAQDHTAAVLDLLVFEPWFLVEGLLLLLAGWWSLRAPGAHRWTVSVLVGAALIDVFGVLLVLGKHHLAVY